MAIPLRTGYTIPPTDGRKINPLQFYPHPVRSPQEVHVSRPIGSRNQSQARAVLRVMVSLYEQEAGWLLSRGKPSDVMRDLIRAEIDRESLVTDGEKKVE